MATQFSETFLDLRLQHSPQALNADLLQVCLPIPLAVELRKITGRRMFSQRQSVLPRQIKKVREQTGVPVHVVVRIQVGRQVAHQFLKATELVAQLGATTIGISEIDDWLPALVREIHM